MEERSASSELLCCFPPGCSSSRSAESLDDDSTDLLRTEPTLSACAAPAAAGGLKTAHNMTITTTIISSCEKPSCLTSEQNPFGDGEKSSEIGRRG